MTNLPANGSTIIFTQIPRSSYASAGEEYTVAHDKGSIRLRNTKTGSGTFDPHWAYAFAAFETIAD